MKKNQCKKMKKIMKINEYKISYILLNKGSGEKKEYIFRCT